jgi:hypothetical protein
MRTWEKREEPKIKALHFANAPEEGEKDPKGMFRKKYYVPISSSHNSAALSDSQESFKICIFS